MNFVFLETKRLLLKGISSAMMNEIFEHLEKPQIMTILGHQNEAEYDKELSKYQRGYSSYKTAFILFLLIRKDTNKIIGRCGIHNWSDEHKRAELGYHLNDEEDKQQGFMSEAVEKVLDYSFIKLDLHRIEAMVSPKNIPSIRIIEKFGFVKEGLMRKHFFIDGNFEDTLIYSRLQSEYKSILEHS